MKLLLVLGLLCAGALADEWNSDENQIQSDREQAVRMRLRPQVNPGPNDQTNEGGFSGYRSNSIGDSRVQSATINSTSLLSDWSTYPEAASFEAKIQARLSSSKILSTKPEERKKLANLAESKFNTCKGLVDEKQRACLGSVTGQMMQLVSAVENINRNPVQ